MTDDFSNAERLAFEHSKAIHDSSLKRDKWCKVKQEYEDLKETITNLPKKLKHDIMVPIGTVGMYQGKLVHTNEIMVLLGDNWFAQCTASQAAEIIGRRIKMVEQNVKEVDDEIKFLESRKKITEQLKQMDQKQDIVEFEEESQQKTSETFGKKRVAHKSKHNVAQRNLKDLDNSRAKSNPSEKNDSKVDELFARLDELELEETMNELKEHDMKMKSLTADDETHVHFEDDYVKEARQVEGSVQGLNAVSKSRDNCIRFKHTSDAEKDVKEEASDDQSQEGSAIKSENGSTNRIFLSPADIYNHFAKHQYVDVEEKPLKSILKKERRFSNEGMKPKPILKHSPEHKSDGSSGDELAAPTSVEDPKPILKSGQEAVHGKVVERETSDSTKDAAVKQASMKKNVSRFKASRMKK